MSNGLESKNRKNTLRVHSYSVTGVDSLAPLLHHDPDRSWITDPDLDHPKGTHP